MTLGIREAMSGKKQRLVADEPVMNWLSLRNNWLKFKISGNSLIITEESIEYISND